MTWLRREYRNPEEYVKCPECGEWGHIWDFDKRFDMCKLCRDLYELEEERDLDRWLRCGGSCLLCKKAFRGATIVRFHQGWAHFGCSERWPTGT